MAHGLPGNLATVTDKSPLPPTTIPALHYQGSPLPPECPLKGLSSAGLGRQPQSVILSDGEVGSQMFGTVTSLAGSPSVSSGYETGEL